MEKLRKWIKKHGTVKQFLEGAKISRSYFCEWELGKGRLGLQAASRIVKYTKGVITYQDLVDFENSFPKEKGRE